MPIDLDNLFLIHCICAVRFNLSSIITPLTYHQLLLTYGMRFLTHIDKM